jgi:hypothetical protein
VESSKPSKAVSNTESKVFITTSAIEETFMEDIAIRVEVPSLLTRAPSAPKKKRRGKKSKMNISVKENE